MSIDTLEQFENMKKIGRIVANCLEYLKAKATPGMTTLELDFLAQKFLTNAGAISAPKSVYQFPGQTCISVEKAVAHGIPNETILKDGDLINIDVSAHLNGYFADNGESFIVGKPNALKIKLCETVKKCLLVAIDNIKDGVLIRSVGKKIEQIASDNNLTIIKNLGGHGVGRSLHEEPKFIPSYFDLNDKRKFKEKQVIAIEPFVSNGADWILEAKDGWTLYHSHFYTAQKEHTLMVTKKKPFIFTIPDQSY